jgi:Carboxylesterase family
MTLTDSHIWPNRTPADTRLGEELRKGNSTMNKTKRLAERRHFTNSRREFISGSLALLSTSCLLDAPRGIAASEIAEPRVTFPVVETTSGKIRGRSYDGIATYRGVPYGAPTGGANRFLPPKRPASWRVSEMHSSSAAPVLRSTPRWTIGKIPRCPVRIVSS